MEGGCRRRRERAVVMPLRESHFAARHRHVQGVARGVADEKRAAVLLRERRVAAVHVMAHDGRLAHRHADRRIVGRGQLAHGADVLLVRGQPALLEIGDQRLPFGLGQCRLEANQFADRHATPVFKVPFCECADAPLPGYVARHLHVHRHDAELRPRHAVRARHEAAVDAHGLRVFRPGRLQQSAEFR